MKNARMLMISFGFIFFASAVATAQYPVIDSEQLRSHLFGKKKVALIDSRTAEEYQQGHIPGAINIMPDHMAEGTRLPKNKSLPVIFYCRGVN